MALIKGLLIVIVCASILISGHLISMGLDSMAGAFGATNRNDVAVADINADRDVDIAVIEADRDVKIITILTQGQLGKSCIGSGANAYRCMVGSGVEGVNSGLSIAQRLALWAMGFIGISATFLIIWHWFLGSHPAKKPTGDSAGCDYRVIPL